MSIFILHTTLFLLHLNVCVGVIIRYVVLVLDVEGIRLNIFCIYTQKCLIYKLFLGIFLLYIQTKLKHCEKKDIFTNKNNNT